MNMSNTETPDDGTGGLRACNPDAFDILRYWFSEADDVSHKIHIWVERVHGKVVIEIDDMDEQETREIIDSLRKNESSPSWADSPIHAQIQAAGLETACSPSVSDTPETDNECAAKGGGHLCPCAYVHSNFARKLERQRDHYREQMKIGVVNGTRVAVERDRLQDAVRACRDAKGRYHTQLAVERLIALLPENAKCPSTQP